MSDASAEAQGPEDEDYAAAVRLARLSAGQLACLRLVNEHLSSKEIAAELHISPHTVDQRVRGALQILGVERRAQAARLVSRYSPEPFAPHSTTHQRLIHQPPYIEAGRNCPQPMATVSHQIRHADRAGGGRDCGFHNRAEARIIPALLADAVRHEEQPPE